MNTLRIAIFFAFACLSVQAVAQLISPLATPQEPDRPLKLNVNAGVTHDSNLFRLSDVVDPQAVIGSSDKSDTVYHVGAGGSYELRASRQRFLLEGNIDDYKFENFSNLDYVGYLARGNWLWQVGNDWDGVLGLGRRRFLEDFANIQTNIKDLVDQNQFYGTANYHLYSRLRLTFDLSEYGNHHSADSQKVYDSTVDNAAFTVNWVTPAENTVGLQYRTANGRYENRQIILGLPVDNAYHENEINVVANWRATGISSFIARLGYTQRNYDELTSRDFSGPTWRLTYDWQPTGKLGFEFATWREIGEFLSVNSNYYRVTGYSIAPMWSVTPNVALQGKVSRLYDRFLGDPGFIPQPVSRSDTEKIYQLSLLWAPLRRTNVTISIEKGERSSNEAVFSYDYRTIGATVVYNF